MKLKHRISFVSGDVIPAHQELTPEQVKKAKMVGGRFYDDEPKPKKATKKKKEDDSEPSEDVA